MIGRLLRFWQSASGKPSVTAPTQTQTPQPPERPASAFHDIALRDLSESGWFNVARGELYPHFPVTEDDVVVDVGCGDGGHAVFCASRGAQVAVVDIDEGKIAATLNFAANQGVTRLIPIVSDSSPLPLPDGFASRIIAAEVLEHVDDTAAFLGELVRVGRSGSLFLLTVPDPVSQGLQKHLAPPLYFEKPNHVRIVGRDEFAQMVTDAGLEIVHRGAYGFYTAMWLQFFWTAGVPLGSRHPLLDRWSDTWHALLATPDGLKVKAVLDAFMPASQSIVARKP